jgi:hypothetical protein
LPRRGSRKVARPQGNATNATSGKMPQMNRGLRWFPGGVSRSLPRRGNPGGMIKARHFSAGWGVKNEMRPVGTLGRHTRGRAVKNSIRRGSLWHAVGFAVRPWTGIQGTAHRFPASRRDASHGGNGIQALKYLVTINCPSGAKTVPLGPPSKKMWLELGTKVPGYFPAAPPGQRRLPPGHPRIKVRKVGALSL